jgi:hypothetical protein
MLPKNNEAADTSNATVEKLLTEHELARWIDMSIHSVRRWRLRRIGPRFLKISSRPGLRGVVRYRPEDVRSWLDSRPGAGGHQAEA